MLCDPYTFHDCEQSFKDSYIDRLNDLQCRSLISWVAEERNTMKSVIGIQEIISLLNILKKEIQFY